MKKSLLSAMVALVVVGSSFCAASAAEQALPKRAVGLVVVQQSQDQKSDKQTAIGAEAAKQQVPVWKFQMVLPKTQTNWYASQELTALTAYINAASGNDVTTALTRDPKSREYLITVSLKQLKSANGDMAITPDIPGLESIEVDSQCPRNTHCIVTFKQGAKPSEEQMLKLCDLVRFTATINHGLSATTEAVINGIDPKTEALTTKPIMKSDGTMSIVVTFPATAFEQQYQPTRFVSGVPVVDAF